MHKRGTDYYLESDTSNVGRWDGELVAIEDIGKQGILVALGRQQGEIVEFAQETSGCDQMPAPKAGFCAVVAIVLDGSSAQIFSEARSKGLTYKGRQMLVIGVTTGHYYIYPKTRDDVPPQGTQCAKAAISSLDMSTLKFVKSTFDPSSNTYDVPQAVIAQIGGDKHASKAVDDTESAGTGDNSSSTTVSQKSLLQIRAP
ncbi:hypothetical protein BDD12DRAFT_873393 [Trichophaea hybrida]|nr:hypothetical protein BDD12DRAFT_873393 [Trichophaea hybrida]